MKTFKDWFENRGENEDQLITTDMRPSMSLISNLVYNALVKGNYRKTAIDNKYECKIKINDEIYSFTIEIDINNRITKITPVE